MKKRLNVLWLACLSLFLSVVCSFADHDIKIISDELSTNWKMGADINDLGNVIWYSSTGNGYDLNFFDGTSTRKIATNIDNPGKLNNKNDVFFSRKNDSGGYSVCFYNNTSNQTFVIRNTITTCNYIDFNESGSAVWLENTRIGLLELPQVFKFKFSDFSVTQLSNSQWYNYAPSINNSGNVVWSARTNDNEDSEIFYHDGNSISCITNDDYDNVAVRINDSNQIVWMTKKIALPWEIYFFENGITKKIGEFGPYNTFDLNNNGHVIWSHFSGIYFFDGVSTTQITSTNPPWSVDSNENDHIMWIEQTGDNSDSKEIFYYDGVNKTQLTSNNTLEMRPLINFTNFISWTSNNQIYLASPVLPIMNVGKTFINDQAIRDQCSVELLFNGSNDPTGASPLMYCLEPLREVSADFVSSNFPPEISVSQDGNEFILSDLPFYLRTRVRFDPVNNKLKLNGYHDSTHAGNDPLVLPNVLTDKEFGELSKLSTDSYYRQQLKQLRDVGSEQFARQYQEGQEPKAITSLVKGGPTNKTGYFVLGFNKASSCAGYPSFNKVFQVKCPPHVGEVFEIKSDDPLDDEVTLRHSLVFDGSFSSPTQTDPGYEFQWKYCENTSAVPEGPETNPAIWLDAAGENGNAITLDSGHPLVEGDKYFTSRYKNHYSPCDEEWSAWTPPKLYKDLSNRVEENIARFENLMGSYHSDGGNNHGSMITLAGGMCEDGMELDVQATDMGLVCFYSLLLDRLLEYYEAADLGRLILKSSGRLFDLYMLLGNEAYGDAADPTIRIDDCVYNSSPSSLHCFKGVLDEQGRSTTLIGEELALLRGLKKTGEPPYCNRLGGNFTGSDGETAYVETYQIADLNGDLKIDSADAALQFPQGHGDAWGHYLSAIKAYYRLLLHDSFVWNPETETVEIGATPTTKNVGFEHERNFATAAAAKAKTGAEIAGLAYGESYESDPELQYFGYKDKTVPNRAWGVDGWVSRGGQGAYIDWVVANAILPAEDAEHTGMEKVDRTTVTEIDEILAQFEKIQTVMDNADTGLDPVGLGKNVIPFDINSSFLGNSGFSGKSHFEQIYDRAALALKNTATIFNYANQSTRMLRFQTESLSDFQERVAEMESDYSNRLVEIFGYPYPEDCCDLPGCAYPAGYQDTHPDLHHFMYVDASKLLEEYSPETEEFTVPAKTYINVDPEGNVVEQTQDIKFHLSKEGFGMVKPSGWTKRKAPGEIQIAQSDLLLSWAQFQKAVLQYKNYFAEIEDQVRQLKALHDLNAEKIDLLNDKNGEVSRLNEYIEDLRQKELYFRARSGFRGENSRYIIESPAVYQKMSIFSERISYDFREFPIKHFVSVPDPEQSQGGETANRQEERIRYESAPQWALDQRDADTNSLRSLDTQHAKEALENATNLRLVTASANFEIEQKLAQLESLIRSEASLRVELYSLMEAIQQSVGRYDATLAKGRRMLEERTRFRCKTAASLQEYRHKDMAYRIFRNDALQKYRAQFDLAKMYVHLAAKAYDYETGLLDSSSLSGQLFFKDLARERTLGSFDAYGNPVAFDGGISGLLARLKDTFDLVAPALGFNNPQSRVSQFSLRKELFRINKTDAESNGKWREVLRKHRVEDLWEIPEFRRYCEFYGGSPSPGIAIPFSTIIKTGLNFFGHPLGGGDIGYSEAYFATKIRSAGVWFTNYNTVALGNSPHAFLVPAGEDIMWAPYNTNGSHNVRTWKVEEFFLPSSQTLYESLFAEDEGWLPTEALVSPAIFNFKRYQDFVASLASYPGASGFGSEVQYNSRLVGRSVWNSNWLLVIPGIALHSDADQGLDAFIEGNYAVTDILLYFDTYSHAGFE